MNIYGENGAIDGARTRDNLDHNQGLYQLSYDRHAMGFVTFIWA